MPQTTPPIKIPDVCLAQYLILVGVDKEWIYNDFEKGDRIVMAGQVIVRQ